VTMYINTVQPWTEYGRSFDLFLRWLSPNPEYNRDLILVMPMWAGPIETYK